MTTISVQDGRQPTNEIAKGMNKTGKNASTINNTLANKLAGIEKKLDALNTKIKDLEVDDKLRDFANNARTGFDKEQIEKGFDKVIEFIQNSVDKTSKLASDLYNWLIGK